MNTFSLARSDLMSYAMLMHPLYQPGFPHRRLIALLEKLECGEIPRLCTVWPPQHGKSTTAALFAGWYLGRNPMHHLVLASYSQDLAEVQGRRIRNYCSSDLHKAIFPNCQLSPDSQSISRFDLQAGGSFTAVGRGAGLTGRSANLLLLDDLVKDRVEADSQTVREATLAWYREVALTRLTADGRILALGTRWHQSDLLSLMVDDPSWPKLILPAIATETDADRNEGDALWPEVRPLKWLEEQKALIGPQAFACLYQCSPLQATGLLFQRSWWKEYSTVHRAGFVAIGIDTSYGIRRENDFNALVAVMLSEGNYYILDVDRFKTALPSELYTRVDRMAMRWHANALVVEAAGRGIDLVHEFKHRTGWPVYAVSSMGHDKRARAQLVLPLVETGRVLIPQIASWRPDFLDEVSAFDRGAHDDQVDALVYALSYLQGRIRRNTVHQYNAFTGQEIPWQESY